jgi:hypothetical protein
MVYSEALGAVMVLRVAHARGIIESQRRENIMTRLRMQRGRRGKSFVDTIAGLVKHLYSVEA